MQDCPSNWFSDNSEFVANINWPLIFVRQQVNRGQMLYGEAAAELANNLAELQKGRVPEQRITDKPRLQYSPTIRSRKESLPRTVPVSYNSGSKHSYNHAYNATMNTSNHNQRIFMEWKKKSEINVTT